MSSVNKANVEGALTAVLASSRDTQKNQNLIINLLDLAAADSATIGQLVRLMQSVTQDRDGVEPGGIQPWRGCSIRWPGGTNRWLKKSRS